MLDIVHSAQSSVSGEVEEVEAIIKSFTDRDLAFLFLNPDFIFGLKSRASAA